jgi:uncharacterized membrane protein
MKATFLVVQVFPLFVTAVLLYFLPHFTSRGVFFGATVDRNFPESLEGKKLTYSYRFEVVIWTIPGLLLAFLASVKSPGLTATPIFLLVLLTAFSYYRRFRTIHLRFGKRVRDIRDVQLLPATYGAFSAAWITAIPFLCLLFVAIYLQLRWNDIPQSFPVHYGADGLPNRWAQRTPGSVFAPVFFGFYMNVFMLALAWLNQHWARRSSMQQLTVRCLQWITWPLSGMFALIALSPVLPIPIWVMVIVVLGGIIAIVAWMIWKYASLTDEEESAPQPDNLWKAGSFYYAPDDPALFVGKRTGLGMTMNFGNRWSWVVMVGVCLAAGLPVVIAVLLSR